MICTKILRKYEWPQIECCLIIFNRDELLAGKDTRSWALFLKSVYFGKQKHFTNRWDKNISSGQRPWRINTFLLSLWIFNLRKERWTKNPISVLHNWTPKFWGPEKQRLTHLGIKKKLTLLEILEYNRKGFSGGHAVLAAAANRGGWRWWVPRRFPARWWRHPELRERGARRKRRRRHVGKRRRRSRRWTRRDRIPGRRTSPTSAYASPPQGRSSPTGSRPVKKFGRVKFSLY